MRLFFTVLTLCLVPFGCGKEERNFDTNPALQDLDGDGFGYYEDCDDTNASIGQPEAGCVDRRHLSTTANAPRKYAT